MAENGINIPYEGSSTARPAISFTADPDTGIHRSAADELDFITGGTSAFKLGSTQNIILTGKRISTSTLNGAALSIPSTHSFGEGIELRYSSALSNTQFQGLFMQVDTSVANTSTIRGAEIAARRSAAVNVGTITGASLTAYTGNGVNTGTITDLIGVNAEAQVDDTFTGTVTIQRAGRFKLQTEDGATMGAAAFTGGVVVGGLFGITIENEFVTGGKKADAAIGVATTSLGTGFDCLINSCGTLTTVSDTDKVLLFKFLNAAGTVTFCRYDTSDNALVFATS